MATETLEGRLTAVEKEIAELKHLVSAKKSNGAAPWWDQMFGAFAESEGFDEAVRLGSEYRQLLDGKDLGKNS